MAMAGEEPDVIIACAGGGSNFAGLTFPFARPQAPRRGRLPGRSRPSPRRRRRLTRGVYAYDFGDTGADGPDREDAHPGLTTSSPSRSTPAACATTACRRSCRLLKEQGVIEARASTSAPASRSASSSPGPEGILPAPESDPRDQGRRSTRRSRRRRRASRA